MSQTTGQVTPLLIAESPVSQSTEVASYQTCDQTIAPPFPCLNEFLFGYVYFMTVCHMARDSCKEYRCSAGILCFSSTPTHPITTTTTTLLWLCVSPHVRLSLFLYRQICLYVLYRQMTHTLSFGGSTKVDGQT